MRAPFFSLTTLALTLSLIIVANATPLEKRAVAYYNPNTNGGSMLDSVGGGLGEPLNVIVSGLSSPGVLTDAGILNYARSIGFSEECLSLHLGDPQSANLGDGNGWVNQTTELRVDYGNAELGTCLESLLGGNHFRVFRQDGAQADSKALFLAVSKEANIIEHHTIIANGYNIGRDELVATAIKGSSYDGVKYQTTSQDVSGLLTAGSTGVNHGIAQDGIVKLLTVTII